MSVIEVLLEEEAIQLSPEKKFTWASGIQSPIYCDNRLLISSPKSRNYVIDKFVDLIQKKYSEVECIAGTATAGIPHAAWIADRLGLPMVYVRGKAKAHGKTNQVEGRLRKGQKVLLIEDLISTGGSSISAVEALKGEEVEVQAVLAIFSYGLPISKKRFSETDLNYESLGDFDELLDFSVKKKHFDKEVAKNLLDWRNSLST
ncbi:MAG: orotate phosphoribosyltransferase [Bdellovibrionales bacterium]